jgi:hypothetical protein
MRFQLRRAARLVARSAADFRRLFSCCTLALAGTFGCHAAPPSQFPTAQAAIERMRETFACSRGLGGAAKLDYYFEAGRVRGEARYLLARPERLRVDVLSPFGAPLSTVVSDGEQFALIDVKERVMLRGPAVECNLMRFIQVPVPPHALLRLLSGEAPVLVHEPNQAAIRWSGGRYVITIEAAHQAREAIELEPHPADFDKPWSEQRLRVRRVEVDQAGYLLYRADFADHRPAPTALARVDEAGLVPALEPSGPQCSAEVPREVRFILDDGMQDLSFVHESVKHNPPLAHGVFSLTTPGGIPVRHVDCDDAR